MGVSKLHYIWRWDMPAPPGLVWPLVCDTHAFNRSAGMGPWTFTETPHPLGGSVREGAFHSALAGRITWDENPFRWVEGKEFSVLRTYRNGPFLEVLSHLELEPAGDGTTLVYSIEARPRSILWSAAARYYLGIHTRRHFDRVFSNVARYLAGKTERAYPQPPPHLPKGSLARLRDAQASLVQLGFRSEEVQRLASYIEEAPDDACDRIKPYALADMWGEDRETVLRLCLQATRLGILELGWDIMCPLCRGDKDRVESLSALRHQAHCPSCNIQFDANFDLLVEVTFRPSEQIRKVSAGRYCVGGPCNTPHILMQRSLAPKESVSLSVDLSSGVHRLRGPQIASSALLEVSPSGPAVDAIQLSCSRQEITPSRTEAAPGQTRLSLENSGEHELLVMLERMTWPDDSVTAAQITALQDFRDLFSSEVLAPEEQFQIRYLAFMFTDLRSSTALYLEKGDAEAYALVRDHFGVISDLVADHHGAVVKTIGDSIMAVFLEPANALAVAFDIHRAFSSQHEKHAELVIKVGIHAGPCIAVNLNGQLDYFGTTVNAAVRLGAHSLGGDVVVAANLFEDAVVSDVLTRPGMQVERLNVQLKGFEGESEICRIIPESDGVLGNGDEAGNPTHPRDAG